MCIEGAGNLQRILHNDIFLMVTACNFSLQISSKVSWKTLQRVQIEKNEKYRPRKTEVKYIKKRACSGFLLFSGVRLGLKHNEQTPACHT